MKLLIIKYLLTAAIIVAVSEIAKRMDRAGALIAALPTTTLLVLIWLHLENQPPDKIANHAWYTFWYVLPTLPMFALFPPLLARLGFWQTLAACTAITAACFLLTALAARKLGIHLL